MVSAVMIGLVLAPLSTHYSLVLDRLTPPHRRPEVFALLRTANAVGVIVTSAVLTVTSVTNGLLLISGIIIVVTAIVAASAWKHQT